jgi:enamine deaminase RidA (YjgF/YER057c/UK114 family)
MATVIGVGMQMTANASGMTKGLSDADKALQLLQKIVEQNQQSLQKFSAEADKTSASVEKLADNTSFLATIEVGRVLVDVGQAIASTFTQVGSTITSIAGPVSSAIDSLNDLSARTGVNVESLQAYSLAAKMAGVDTASFAKAAQALAVNIGKAAPGDALDKSLKGINLSVAELRTLSPERQFAAIGDAISVLPTAADRAAAAVAVFGKQGLALAPLFREGAASIDELTERANRLGIIVSEVQVSNIAEMNDAFDLVGATIQGIIGQVVGNLAPAVTDVTNQFLRFVEEWSLQGEGGTGIANAITDVLLRGAEIFAGVFDQFVGNFGGFTTSITEASAVFEFVANTFTALTESLRQVFNLFEMVGNGIMLAIGKLLEEVGAWVSDDLAQVGADLANEASAAMAQNQKEFLEAGANSFQAGLNAVGLGEGETSAAARGQGAATAYVQSFREQVQASQAPEIKVATNLDTTEERLQKFLATATDGGSEFLRQSTQTLDTFQKMTEEGGLTADQIKIMNGFMANLNAELDKELATRREAIEATAKQAEEDQKRIKELLKPSEEADKVQSDLDAVYREQSRVQEQLAAARSAAASAQTESARQLAQKEAAAAAASLASLDQIEAKLKETQQAAKQGFSDGFAKQFKETEKAIESARVKASDFGRTGLSAASALATGVAALQERARAGFLNKAEYDQQLARLQGFFEEALKREQENQRLVAETKQAANVRVEQFLKAQLDERTKQEIAQQEEIAKRKQQSLENVAALQERIATQEKAVAAAREGKDLGAARARQAELTLLKKTLVEEKKIANGRQQANRQQAQQLQQGNTAAQQFQSLVARQNDAFLQGFQNAYAGANAALAQSARVAEEQARRMEALTRPTNATVNVADIRTAEGQALVQDVAAQAQDPALIEARLQTRLLNAIASGITGAASNYFNQPVAIVGAARMG